jgi:RND family efflux transporter MFP subunit
MAGAPNHKALKPVDDVKLLTGPDSHMKRIAGPPPQKAPVSRRWLWVAIGIGAVLLILVAWGVVSRIVEGRQLQKATDEQAIPIVALIDAKPSPAEEELVLPGNVQANFDTAVYARVSGYVKRWYTDIGTPVVTGQLLADIDTPEVDDQLRQAEADLGTAIANNTLAQSTAERWRALRKTDSVSKQETEEKIGDAQAKAAMVASARANVARLQKLEGFKHVVAPFDGVVTARETDVGALINAGSGQGPELFRVADRTKLRIYVQVPQTYAGVVVPDLPVDLQFAEYPGKSFKARMTRSSRALDPQARTLLVELQADNANGQLFPGGLTEVHMKLPAETPSLRVPASALLFRSEGLLVATMDKNGHAMLHAVTLGRDFGKEVEITTGLQAGQKVIMNPPDSLRNDEPVREAKQQNEQAGGGPTGGKQENSTGGSQ